MTGFEGARSKLEFDKVLHRITRYAASDPGRELLNSLPVFTSRTEIRRQLSRVSECKALIEEEGELPLQGIYSVRTAIQKAAVEGTTLLPRELLHIASSLRASRLVRTSLAKRKENIPELWEMAEQIVPDKVLEFNIEHAIDENGAVRASASRDLQEIRRAMSERYDQLRRRLESILRQASDLGFSQEEIITTREGRMVIPVKSEHKSRVPGFIHSASASGATVFIEPTETLELNNEIRSLQFDEQREVERILRDLTKQVGAGKDQHLITLELLAEFDAVSAKAKYSVEILGTAPDIMEGGTLHLLKARHPLLLLAHGRAATVPLDVELGGEFTTLIISGPNAGGKTVAMKCVGLLVLMAQAGLHIPAEEGSRVRVFDSVFVEVGDEQSIENDLSTFSSHLSHLKQISDGAGTDSLVLIDEIGSGTDPAEGSAIATSVLEVLTSRRALTIATTHQSTLKVFAHETPGVENAGMEYDQTTLTPTYRLRLGIPGSSYALEMAERLGFSRELLENSRRRLGQQQSKLDALIEDLEAQAQRLRRELDEVISEKTKLTGLVRQYEERVSRMSEELKTMKRKAIDEAESILARANSVIEQSIKDIRESAGSKESIRQTRIRVTELKGEIIAAHQEVTVKAPMDERPTLELGAEVTILDGSDVGEIVDVSGDRSTATVVFGNVKMRVPSADLRRPRKRAVPVRRSDEIEALRESLRAERELDLRGLTGDEATPRVDKFIDDAILAGFSRVEIIHGKGTGALRKRITEFLAQHPRVKSFRLGDWNEGGDGATIVELSDAE